MTLKVAIVGMGNIGNVHGRVYQAHPDTEIVAVCDIIEEKADRAAEKYGCQGFYSVQEMLDSGVKFDMAVVMSDTMTAATCATLMKGLVILKKTQGTPTEKTALDRTTIDSNSGTLTVDYSSSDSEFASLLSSPLFQSVVR